MTKLLIVSFEATEPNVVTAAIQQVTLTFAEKREEEDSLRFLKETSFFIDNYQIKDFFDAMAGIPLANDLSYNGYAAYESVTKRYPLNQAIALIQKAVNHASYVVVHNGLDYHVPIMQRDGIDFLGKVIIDTAEHIPYAEQVKSRKLIHLCAEHNFCPYQGKPRPRTESVNHAILKLLNLYSVEASINKAIEEGKKTIMLIAKIDYAQNAEAKKLGFRFDASTKKWSQKVSQERYEELLAIMGSKHLEVEAQR